MPHNPSSAFIPNAMHVVCVLMSALGYMTMWAAILSFMIDKVMITYHINVFEIMPHNRIDSVLESIG